MISSPPPRQPMAPTPKKSAGARSNGSIASTSSPSSPELTIRPLGPLSVLLDKDKERDREREPTKINKFNASDLKNACDDALKHFLSHPDLFRQNHVHTDVRLALGWSCVFVAFGTGLYGWKFEFEKAKPVVWVGVILYVVLSLVQTLYAYFVEGDTVFLGKRKTFNKRIVTERITISTRSIPHSQSSSSTKSSSPCPSYSLTVSYLRSTSSGKSLLAKGKTTRTRPFNEFFEESGTLDLDVFEGWVGEAVEEIMDGEAK